MSWHLKTKNISSTWTGFLIHIYDAGSLRFLPPQNIFHISTNHLFISSYMGCIDFI